MLFYDENRRCLFVVVDRFHIHDNVCSVMTVRKVYFLASRQHCNSDERPKIMAIVGLFFNKIYWPEKGNITEIELLNEGILYFNGVNIPFC